MTSHEGTETTDSVDLVIETRVRDVGGFQVRRSLPYKKRKMIGPFIFFDHMGPVGFEPGSGIAVLPHPHIGIATVTYLFEGEIVHRDSLGWEQTIQPGAVNWMTAGRGIVHSERSGPADLAGGARVHGIQSWVALPLEHEETEPTFVHHPADALPSIQLDGALIKVIAGRAYEIESPVEALSELFYLDVEIEAGASLCLPSEHAERGAYIVNGDLTVGGDRYPAGHLVVFRTGADARLRAGTPTRVMLLGGAPLGGERYIWWNFVASDRARIERAKRDWKEGRFEKVPGDEVEFAPLPD